MVLESVEGETVSGRVASKERIRRAWPDPAPRGAYYASGLMAVTAGLHVLISGHSYGPFTWTFRLGV
jgi:hypothetical protein